MTTTFLASPAPDTEPESLFEQLGGYAGIRSTVRLLFERLVDDPVLSPTFGRVDIEQHVAAMATVVGEAAGAPEPDSRHDLAAAYQHLQVTSEQFDRI